jgi:putative oxidoreductase
VAFLAFIGRVIFGLFFIQSGLQHLVGMQGMAGYAAAKGVPAPKFSVVFSGLMLLFGGVTAILGVWMAAGGIVLAIALVAFAFVLHNYWTVSDAGQRMGERAHFYKDLALTGAALMLTAMPATVWHL